MSVPRRCSLLLVLAAIACVQAASALDFPIPIRRGGLPNTFARLRNGQTLRIAYIGGSVTENTGWRDNTTAWFNARWPGKITEKNAGWSGTGTAIGALRFGRDVMTF